MHLNSDHDSTGDFHSKAVLIRRWCRWDELYFRDEDIVRHVEYPRSRFWLLLKRQGALDYCKAEQERQLKEIFKETVINIAVKAKIHLVAAISSQEYQEDYIRTKVSDWVSEVIQLERFAQRRSTGMLCCFHLRLKTSVDLPPKNQDLLERLVNPVSLLVIIVITESNFNQSN